MGWVICSADEGEEAREERRMNTVSCRGSCSMLCDVPSAAASQKDDMSYNWSRFQ